MRFGTQRTTEAKGDLHSQDELLFADGGFVLTRGGKTVFSAGPDLPEVAEDVDGQSVDVDDAFLDLLREFGRVNSITSARFRGALRSRGGSSIDAMTIASVDMMDGEDVEDDEEVRVATLANLMWPVSEPENEMLGFAVKVARATESEHRPAISVGIHGHMLRRQSGDTARDGQHAHIFRVPKDVEIDGVAIPADTLLETQRDGRHKHDIRGERAAAGGKHSHIVAIVGLPLMSTQEDGQHDHVLSVASTGMDGAHIHRLDLPDGTTLRSLNSEQLAELFDFESDVAGVKGIVSADYMQASEAVTANDVAETDAEDYENPYDDAPPAGSGPVKYVVQAVHRGAEVSHDLRFEHPAKSFLLGWKLLDSKPLEQRRNTIAVNTVARAQQFVNESDTFIDWASGEFWSRETADRRLQKVRVEAVPKLPHDVEWLDAEGVFSGGDGPVTVYLIVDQGSLDYGWQQANSHEYFFSGGKLAGRIVIRAIDEGALQPRGRASVPAPGTDKGEHVRGRFGDVWLAIQTEDQTPQIISSRAVTMRKIAAAGVSCLPMKIEAAVPESFRYWNVDDRDERMAMRDRLVEKIGQTGAAAVIRDTKAADVDSEELRAVIDAPLISG